MLDALREVRLYGALGREFGRVHRLAVATTAEAVQALCVVLPGFERALLGPDGQAAYHVFVGRGAGRAAIALPQTADPVGKSEPIRIVPAIAGAKRGGLLPVLLGAALLFAAPYLAGAVGTSFGIGAAGIVNTATLAIGKALILGGVVQLLSPQNRQGATQKAENAPSYNFDGPVNTTQEGLPVPLGYGRCVVGGAVISAGISTSDQAVTAPAPPAPPPQDLPPEQPTYPEVAGP